MEKFVKPEIISLKDHPQLDEKWVQSIIAEDPSILGLGELLLKDIERVQPNKGRLDLLLYDPENNKRYEVEIQLGKTDESHIIRTIEYWDYQRKKFPQYEHCAVLIAEDITSRFLNVISLFNGTIPFIAIQMKAIKFEDKITLVFTKILDEFSFGLEEEDEDYISVDRNYWEQKGSKESLEIVDNLLELIRNFAPGFSLKYNKHYIGLTKDGISKNFVSFVPRKKAVILEIKHPKTSEVDNKLENSDLDLLSYDNYFKVYRVRIKKQDIESSCDLLVKLMQKAYENYEKR